MHKNEALFSLCKVLLSEPQIVSQPDWKKLVLLGQVGPDHCGMEGYSFNSRGDFKAISPRSAGLEALELLHQRMQADNANGRAWKQCLIRISSAGGVGADFEYDSDMRWTITVDNYQERIAEFAAISI